MQSLKMEYPKKQEVDEISNEESTLNFFEHLGISETLPEFTNSDDFYARLIGDRLVVDHISRGHITCSFTVKPCLANFYNGLHGGVVAAVAERLATACARTVVAEDKQLFLGEMSISYLSAAAINGNIAYLSFGNPEAEVLMDKPYWRWWWFRPAGRILSERDIKIEYRDF